jgi:hypothetical protein
MRRVERSRIRSGRLLAAVLLLGGLALPGLAQPVAETKTILRAPPLQWDSTVASFRPALRQTITDFANLTGGIVFGLKPPEVNTQLPRPMQGFATQSLPLAAEFPEDVRYFWIRLGMGGPLDAGIDTCVGEASYLVFLFRGRGLFRISYRLIPNSTCPSVAAAASAVMAHYVPIDPEIALVMHYRNGNAEVVDVVDPGSGHLRSIRWQQRR